MSVQVPLARYVNAAYSQWRPSKSPHLQILREAEDELAKGPRKCGDRFRERYEDCLAVRPTMSFTGSLAMPASRYECPTATSVSSIVAAKGFILMVVVSSETREKCDCPKKRRLFRGSVATGGHARPHSDDSFASETRRRYEGQQTTTVSSIGGRQRLILVTVEILRRDQPRCEDSKTKAVSKIVILTHIIPATVCIVET